MDLSILSARLHFDKNRFVADFNQFKGFPCADRRKWEIGNQFQLKSSYLISCIRAPKAIVGRVQQNEDLPTVLPKKKKKPYLTPRKRGGSNRFKKREVREFVLQPPANGLLVPELIPVAHEVMEARATLIDGVTQLMEVLPVQACGFCSEIHVGQVGHQIASCRGPNSAERRARHQWTRGNIDDVIVPVDTFHLADRLGRTIQHEERFNVERLPAVVELCIQAGVDLPEYPIKRRNRPVRMVGRRIPDLGPMEEHEEDESEFTDEDAGEKKDIEGGEGGDVSMRYGEVNDSAWEAREKRNNVEEWVHPVLGVGGYISESSQVSTDNTNMVETILPSSTELVDLAEKTLQAWDKMRSGARKLMMKYAVKVCGYCPEIHVGPKGHRVKLCGAFKHQWRAGQHGWQEASVDDLIPPKYVWHVRERDGPPLAKELKSYYGQAPAVVELCVQAGAKIPNKYRPMMRLDVVIPDMDEIEKVA